MNEELQQLQETAELRDALHVFGEYLSDKVAPLMALDALELLMDLPPALVGREIVTWCVRQVEVQGGALATSDLLFHSARKIHMMGDFDLIEAAELDRFLLALGPILVEACPPDGREQLKLGLSRLDASRQALATKVEIVHRQSGAPESVAQAAALAQIRNRPSGTWNSATPRASVTPSPGARYIGSRNRIASSGVAATRAPRTGLPPPRTSTRTGTPGSRTMRVPYELWKSDENDARREP